MFDIDEHPTEQGRLLFLVMELLAGEDLGALLARHSGGLPIEHVVDLTMQAADALAAAHAHGIVHRDIKPANLFPLGDGRLKICDFGIARLADAATRLTVTGGFIGTPSYMAPEQFLELLAKNPAERPAGAAAVAATGVVLGGGAFALRGAFGDDGPRPTPTASPGRSVRSVPSDPRPVTAEWQAVLAPKYGLAYDVPPGWHVQKAEYSSYVEDDQGQVYAGENAVASAESAKCTRAQTGLRGGSNPVPNPGDGQVPALTGAAQTEARKWISALYGGIDTPPRPPVSKPGATSTVMLHGVMAVRVPFAVTTLGGSDRCTPPHARVETIAMAASKNAATSGPVIFTVFTDRDVPGRLSDADLNKIVESIRPYGCPAGAALTGNTCSSGGVAPTPG